MEILYYFLFANAYLFQINYIQGLWNGDEIVAGANLTRLNIGELLEKKMKELWKANTPEDQDALADAREVLDRIFMCFHRYYIPWRSERPFLLKKHRECITRLNTASVKMNIREVLKHLHTIAISSALRYEPLSVADKYEISISLRLTLYDGEINDVIQSAIKKGIDIDIQTFAQVVTSLSDKLSEIDGGTPEMQAAQYMEWSQIQPLDQDPFLMENIYEILGEVWRGTFRRKVSPGSVSRIDAGRFGIVVIRSIPSTILDSDIIKLCDDGGILKNNFFIKTQISSSTESEPKSKILIFKVRNADETRQEFQQDDCIYNILKGSKDELDYSIRYVR